MTGDSWLRRRYLIDRTMATVLGVLCFPLVAVLAVVIRLRDPGPGLIGLTRVGLGGRPFRMWKLRTMRHIAQDEAAGPPITTAADPRVTATGKVLRRWRIDELPQLWNVARGEMALIGPRPEAPEYVDMDDERWRAVLQARPGIAGLTQALVHQWEPTVLADSTFADPYREEILPVKLSLDRWYVNQSSANLDLLIVQELFASFVLARPPYRLRRRAEDAGVLPVGLLDA